MRANISTWSEEEYWG